MKKKPKREEWLRDIDARQRNIVFSDTAANEARFWRNLYEGKEKLSRAQAIGVAVMAAVILASVIVVSVLSMGLGWGNELTVRRVLSGAAQWMFAFAIIAGFLLIIKLATRQKVGRR